ncbi:MAG TPA: cytochrome c oxidase subunit 3 family protein [Vicinamibacterales bacterium]|nr:cytochrome c oxidase subunit 3 family protein [Vicinamibacterales bacterium]
MTSQAAVAPPRALQHHFDSLEQQRDVATLGMWIFLVTEALFFGGLFTAYLVYRSMYPHAFAVASEHTLIALGAANTAILITSSLTMALAVHAAQEGNQKSIIRFLVFTFLLGTAFLVLKGVEYTVDMRDHLLPGANFAIAGANPGHAEIFFSLYFIMTGLHAIHMIVGLSLLVVIMYMTSKGRFSKEYHAPVEVMGLYWHFVDIIWIFLFPLLYLIDRHK